MTVEEALAASVVEPVNDIFEIDPETRVITVPNCWNDDTVKRNRHIRCYGIIRGHCVGKDSLC